MRYALVLLLFLVSCSTQQSFVKGDSIATPTDVAKIQIKPNTDLPEPMDLSQYKIDLANTRQYKEKDINYIAIPEKDMLNQEKFLLELKTRILQLQKIIIDIQKQI